MAIEIKNKKEEQAREELTLLIQRYPVLSGIEENIWQAFSMMRDSYDKGGKLLLCGNGGQLRRYGSYRRRADEGLLQ